MDRGGTKGGHDCWREGPCSLRRLHRMKVGSFAAGGDGELGALTRYAPYHEGCPHVPRLLVVGVVVRVGGPVERYLGSPISICE